MRSTGKERNKYLSLSRWVSGELSFYNKPKIQNPAHEDYQPSSPDLPLPANCWSYNVESYERELQESIKNEKKIANLSQLKNRNVV